MLSCAARTWVFLAALALVGLGVSLWARLTDNGGKNPREAAEASKESGDFAVLG
jgi:hypothetical protein